MNALERAAAIVEIQQLAHRYAICVDAKDVANLAALFVDDVQVGRELRGREALSANFAEQLRGVGISFLHVGNHAIDFADDEHASGVVYCRAEIQDQGPDSERWIVQAIQYHDRYERRAEGWRFVRRQHFLVYGADLAENPLRLGPAEWPRSQTGRGTHPQALESWRRFWGR